MRELRVITLHVDPSTGVFDNGPLVGYLRDRELLGAEPAFFNHDGRPAWSIVVQTRRLQGAEPVAAPKVAAKGAAGGRVEQARQDGERAAFRTLLAELDEDQRARYRAPAKLAARRVGSGGGSALRRIDQRAGAAAGAHAADVDGCSRAGQRHWRKARPAARPGASGGAGWRPR